MSASLFALRVTAAVNPALEWGFKPGLYLGDVLSAFEACSLVQAKFYANRKTAEEARKLADHRIEGLTAEVVCFSEAFDLRKPEPPHEDRRVKARRRQPAVFPAKGPLPMSRRTGRERR